MKNKLLLVILTMIFLFPFSFSFAQTVSTSSSPVSPSLSATQDTQALIKQLQTLILSLQTQINDLKVKLEATQKEVEIVKLEIQFTKSLVRGAEGDEVKQLQEVLKQDPEIYPEGLVTGFFGPATEAAVKRFQEKHGIESLGIIGPKTRARLNELITSSFAKASEDKQGAGKSGVISSGLERRFGTTTPEQAPFLSTPSGIIPAQPIGLTGSTTIPAVPAQSGTTTGATTTSAIPAVPAQPVGQTGMTTVLATPAVPVQPVQTTVTSPPPASAPSPTPAPAPTLTPTFTPTPTPTPSPSPTATTTASIADTTAPSSPTNLTATPVYNWHVTLTWSKSTDNVDVVGYNVYRNGTQLFSAATSSSLSTLTYRDWNVTAGTAYSYTVAAYDAVGNVSAQSSSVSVTPVAEQTSVSPSPSPSPSPSSSPTSSTITNHSCGSPIYIPQDTSSVQVGLNAACSGDIVYVAAGTYHENIVVPRAGLTLKGAIDTTAGNVIIDVSGLNKDAVSTAFSFTIEGITLQGSQGNSAPGSVGLIINTKSITLPTSSVTITARHLIIQNNNFGIFISNVTAGTLTFDSNLIINNNHAGIDMGSWGSSAVYLTNNTIANNGVVGISEFGGGGTHTLKNNIIVNNGKFGIFKHCSTPAFSIQYNNVWNNPLGNYIHYSCSAGGDVPFTPSSGTGEFSVDPKFVSTTDYHLQSSSPMINIGDPSLIDADGSRSDIGVYPFNITTGAAMSIRTIATILESLTAMLSLLQRLLVIH